MIQEGVAAGGGDGVELMVGKAAAEVAAGSSQGVKELIARIMETIGAEDGFEAAFVKAGVVGHEGHIGRETVGIEGGHDAVFNLVPDIREERGIFGVIRSQAMDLLAEPGVVVRVRMNKAVEGVHHFPIANDDNAHGANAAGATVSGFKVYDDRVVH